MSKPQKHVVALAKDVIEGNPLNSIEIACLQKAAGIKGEIDYLAHKVLRDYAQAKGFFKKAA